VHSSSGLTADRCSRHNDHFLADYTRQLLILVLTHNKTAWQIHQAATPLPDLPQPTTILFWPSQKTLSYSVLFYL